MPYSYTPKMRVTPPAGAATTYDLSTWAYISRQEVRDAPVASEKEMLDLTVEQTRYGFRRTVGLTAEFPVGSSSNETDFMTIIRRAVDDEYTVELSLDNGTTYREVVLSEYSAEDMEGKKIGRIYRTTWTVKALQEQPVAVLGGSW